MNKNILFGAATILFCSFFALVSFKGKTKEQQIQEITAAVEAKISELRTEKVEECNARVLEVAQVQFDSIQEAAASSSKKGIKRSTKKKTYTKPKTTNTTVDPVPTAPTVPPPPPPPAPNPKADKMNKEQVKNTAEKASKMAKQPNTDKKKSKMNKGGGN